MGNKDSQPVRHSQSSSGGASPSSDSTGLCALGCGRPAGSNVVGFCTPCYTIHSATLFDDSVTYPTSSQKVHGSATNTSSSTSRGSATNTSSSTSRDSTGADAGVSKTYARTPSGYPLGYPATTTSTPSATSSGYPSQAHYYPHDTSRESSTLTSGYPHGTSGYPSGTSDRSRAPASDVSAMCGYPGAGSTGLPPSSGYPLGSSVDTSAIRGRPKLTTHSSTKSSHSSSLRGDLQTLANKGTPRATKHTVATSSYTSSGSRDAGSTSTGQIKPRSSKPSSNITVDPNNSASGARPRTAKPSATISGNLSRASVDALYPESKIRPKTTKPSHISSGYSSSTSANSASKHSQHSLTTPYYPSGGPADNKALINKIRPKATKLPPTTVDHSSSKFVDPLSSSSQVRSKAAKSSSTSNISASKTTATRGHSTNIRSSAMESGLTATYRDPLSAAKEPSHAAAHHTPGLPDKPHVSARNVATTAKQGSVATGSVSNPSQMSDLTAAYGYPGITARQPTQDTLGGNIVIAPTATSVEKIPKYGSGRSSTPLVYPFGTGGESAARQSDFTTFGNPYSIDGARGATASSSEVVGGPSKGASTTVPTRRLGSPTEGLDQVNRMGTIRASACLSGSEDGLDRFDLSSHEVCPVPSPLEGDLTGARPKNQVPTILDRSILESVVASFGLVDRSYLSDMMTLTEEDYDQCPRSVKRDSRLAVLVCWKRKQLKGGATEKECVEMLKNILELYGQMEAVAILTGTADTRNVAQPAQGQDRAESPVTEAEVIPAIRDVPHRGPSGEEVAVTGGCKPTVKDSGSHKKVKGIRENLMCPIHLDLLENAKTLPCQHVICEECLGDWVASHGVLKCPSCNTTHTLPPGGVSELPNNFVINSLVDELKKIDVGSDGDDQEDGGASTVAVAAPLEVGSASRDTGNKDHDAATAKLAESDEDDDEDDAVSTASGISNFSAMHDSQQGPQGQKNAAVPQNSTLMVVGEGRVINGERIKLKLQLADREGKRVRSWNMRRIKSSVFTPQGKELRVRATFNKRNGDYRLSFFPRKIGVYIFEVLLDHEQVGGSPVRVVVHSSEDGDNLENEGANLIAAGIRHTYSDQESDEDDTESIASGISDYSTSQDFLGGPQGQAGTPIAGNSILIKVGKNLAASRRQRIKLKLKLADLEGRRVRSRNSQRIAASVATPEGEELRVQVTWNKKTGDYWLNFVPEKIGVHVFAVRFDDEQVGGSPLKVVVRPIGSISSEQSFKNSQLRAGIIEVGEDIDDFREFIDESVKLRDGKNIILQMRCEPNSGMSLYGYAKSDGRLYVTDINNSCVCVFKDGNWLKNFGKRVLDLPTGIAIDNGGTIFVADSSANSIDVFRPNYSHSGSIELEGKSENSSLALMALNQAQDKIIVADEGMKAIKVCDINSSKVVKVIKSRIQQAPAKPFGVLVDKDDNIFVSALFDPSKNNKNRGNSEALPKQRGAVIVYNSNGYFLGTIGENELVDPRGICWSSDEPPQLIVLDVVGIEDIAIKSFDV